MQALLTLNGIPLIVLSDILLTAVIVENWGGKKSMFLNTQKRNKMECLAADVQLTQTVSNQFMSPTILENFD